MEIHDAIKRVEESDAFARLQERESGAYLVHVFSMHPQGEDPEWQVGYYAPRTKKLIVFETQPVKELPPDDAFNKGEEIKVLNLDDVAISFATAEEKAVAFLQQLRPAETVTKVIVLLQHLDRTLYNITLVTNLFNILNVRIDAKTGEVYQHDLRSILSLRKR